MSNTSGSAKATPASPISPAATSSRLTDFDYLLKPGVTQEANALAIARLAGVPI